MRGLAALLWVSSVCACRSVPSSPAPSCQPLGLDKPALLALRTQAFAIGDETQRRTFALQLVDCLGAPDPALRDQIAYEGFATLLRGKQLSAATVRELRERLVSQLTEPDAGGWQPSFTALALSEVARADRIEPIFSVEERAALVAAGVEHMRQVQDYRGYDPVDGWRHDVAHTADLLLQLALNPNVLDAQLVAIRDAVATQVAPPGSHFYIYGEGERLARPILVVADRDAIPDPQWATWFGQLASPAPLTSWDDAFSHQEGLARLHNTKAFALAIYASAATSESVPVRALAAHALTLLRALP